MDYYDDMCAACNLEQSAEVKMGKTTWSCYRCDYENEVNQID